MSSMDRLDLSSTRDLQEISASRISFSIGTLMIPTPDNPGPLVTNRQT